MKKILFLLPSLLQDGGAETQTIELVNGIDPGRFEKHLFTYGEDLTRLHRIDREKVHFYNFARRYKLDLFPVKKIAEVIDAEKIDIIHCTLEFSLLMGWLARLISQRKPHLVTALHTTISRTKKEAVLNHLLYRYLLRVCEKIIFVCDNQRRYWLDRFPELENLSAVIHNGVDINDFDPESHVQEGVALRSDLGIPESSPVISCLAGFRPKKGHSFLVEAFSRLNDDAFLLLAGDGQTRPEIEGLVKEKSIMDRVNFLGSVNTVKPVLSASNVTVLASTSESFSMSILESMAMNIPVVTTRVGGAEEIITEGKTGFVVEPADIVGLADVLSQAVRHPEKLVQMGKGARKIIKSRFTKETMIEKTEDLLGSVRV